MEQLNQINKSKHIIDKNGETTLIHVGRGATSFRKKLVFQFDEPDITHQIIIKAVLWDQSQLDLEAVLTVNRNARNTDTFLKICCLLLSENTSANVIPALEIMTDEVSSGHSATVSPLDQEQVHYLQSRGLSREESQKILVEAFLSS